MDKNKIDEIIKQNFEFYKNHAEEFSKTRQNPWDGWQKCLQILTENTDKDHINVLDIACGNGRFYKFLEDNLHKSVSYLGVDNNDFMMLEGILKYGLAEFKNLDVLQERDKIEGTYDLITVFGLTHHIPGQEFRLDWFNKLPRILNTRGILILTFWNLSEDNRFKKAQKAENLEENDFYYGWGESEDKRYVHIYTDEEINTIKQDYEKQNLKLIEKFYADGKTGKLNRYLIFKLYP